MAPIIYLAHKTLWDTIWTREKKGVTPCGRPYTTTRSYRGGKLYKHTTVRSPGGKRQWSKDSKPMIIATNGATIPARVEKSVSYGNPNNLMQTSFTCPKGPTKSVSVRTRKGKIGAELAFAL